MSLMKKSQLLKLDAPFNVIYAGGYVGRHIATLVTWKEDEEGDMDDWESYPILDLGEEYPAGKLVPVDVEDCRVLCPQGGTNLFWLAKIIEYDFQQLEPAGVDYILHRMKLLDCKVALPMEKGEDGEPIPQWDYTISLDFWQITGKIGTTEGEFRARSGGGGPFYFEAYGTVGEIYRDLSMQVSFYQDFFFDDLIKITFHTDDLHMTKVTRRLNADQHIEGFEHEEDYDW